MALSAALLAAVGAATAQAPDAAAARPTPAPATPARSIEAIGADWFLVGATMPWLERGCDFGCGTGRGVRGTRERVDVMLRDMSRSGIRVVRWHMLSNGAWQVRRDSRGMPTSLHPAVALDLDEALRLAARHDVFLLPVLLPDPGQVPATWMTRPAHARALAATLRPLFARHRAERHLLGWEIATAAERLEDSGAATRPQLRAHARRLIVAIRQVDRDAHVAISPGDVGRIDSWTGLGATMYTPLHVSGAAPAACATCRSVAALARSEGADAPVVIGGYDAATTALSLQRQRTFQRLGYAGALAWSWRGTEHPGRPGVASPLQPAALERFHYDVASSGPRSRPLNPCLGPDARRYRCPNLRMSDPSAISADRSGGRTILYSTNSVNSVGRGPASLHGRRDLERLGRYAMAATQLLHRADGRAPLSIDTGARLQFKAIPGQYRYWKWNGAARMELWRLDSTGQPIERTRVGPKTVYCLRDLKRTRGSLRGSPPDRVYPACSQRADQQRITLGTSVGWSDVYPASYHENWIDATGLRGCFAYVHIADPTNVIYESNEDDNASSTVVRLPWRGMNDGCPGARPLPTVGANGTY